MKVSKIYRLAVAIIVFSVTAVCFSVMLDYQRLSSDFKADVADINRLFVHQITGIETVLISLSGLHQASDNLNFAELSSFSMAMLKAYPFIDSIIGMENLKPNNVLLFEKRMIKQGYVGFKLKSKKIFKRRSANDFYLPINFIEPMTPRSAGRLGLDVLSIKNIPPVIAAAVKSGKAKASKISKLFNSNRSSILIFKALYLGRYPPDTSEKRQLMLDGFVALEVDASRFIELLKLSDYGVSGNVSNLTDFEFNANQQKILSFNFFLESFQFIEKFKMYGQSYKLKIKREIDISMINKEQALLFWFVSMLVLVFILRLLARRKASADEIKYLAYYDSLTTLPNRFSFKERLKLAIDDSLENKISGAVLFMDIDEFKRINDTLGHDIGDELLKQVSKRLIQQMRQSDTISLDNRVRAKNFVTRLGGDEFTVLLTDIKNPSSAGYVAKRILQHISEPFHLNGHEVYVTASIGVAIFPDDGHDIDQLLKHADTAMYHAKNMGKNNFQFYFEEMSSLIEERLKLEGKLHQAIDKNEFCLYYQAQIDAKTDEIVAAEALIRWQQTELGMIFPDEFIPLAEETGQILSIGEWVIETACRQNKNWQLAGFKPIRVAINLSSLQFMQDDLCKNIAALLHKYDLKSEYLELEITEGIMMKNIEQSISMIKDLTDMGIGVSVDDFGTGYSSLSYLKKFPIESLKIDRSFVMDIPKDKDDVMITSAIISMAKNLNLKVIAEGVENQQQVDFLKQHDCDLMQGYYFSKPIPADEFEKLLSKR